MAFELPDLPYPYDALEPYMSSRTLHLHHDKHHQTYVTNLNNLIEDTDLKKASLEEIVQASAKDPAKAGIFNNAGQAWNHNLFWRVMKRAAAASPTASWPSGSTTPSAASRPSRSSSRLPPSPSSAAAGVGSLSMATHSRCSRPRTAPIRWSRA